eukprot:Rhum_TRINITY_DN25891_c0_g1::Rhum_TRINITY_DN25891_c0_g1_i1::g.182796::m.182796
MAKSSDGMAPRLEMGEGTNAKTRDTHISVAADRWRLRQDRLLTATSLLGVLLMIIQNLVLYYHRYEVVVPSVSGQTPTVEHNFYDWQEVFALVIECVIICTTALALYLLSQYYRNLLQLKQREWSSGILGGGRKNAFQMAVQAKKMEKEEGSYGFVRSSLFPKYLCEVLIHIVLPYPGVPRSKPIYQILQLVMFSRLYLVLRMLHTSSNAFLKRSRINSYYADFRRMNLKIRWTLTLKMLFYDNPVTAVIAALLFTLTMSGFCMFVLERDNTPSFDDPLNCMWFSFVTLSTVGYGDMYPSTHSGRFVACLTGLMGHVVAALFGGILTNKLAPSKTQQLISVFLDNQTAEVEFRHAAATLIQSVWREAAKADKNVAFAMRMRGGTGSAAAALGTVIGKKDEGTLRVFRQVLTVRNHKRNKVYAAVKIFRNTRHQVAKAQLTAADPALEQKLDLVIENLTALTDYVMRDRCGSDADSNAGLSGAHKVASFRQFGDRNGSMLSLPKKKSSSQLKMFAFGQNKQRTASFANLGLGRKASHCSRGSERRQSTSGKEGGRKRQQTTLTRQSLEAHNLSPEQERVLAADADWSAEGKPLLEETDSEENVLVESDSSLERGWLGFCQRRGHGVSLLHGEEGILVAAVVALAGGVAARRAVRGCKAHKKRKLLAHPNPLLSVTRPSVKYLLLEEDDSLTQSSPSSQTATAVGTKVGDEPFLQIDEIKRLLQNEDL